MSLRIVQNEGLFKLNIVYRTEQPAENHKGFVHMRRHSGTANREGLKGYIHRGRSAMEEKRTVKPLGIAFYIDVIQLVELSVNKKAVFIAEAVIADAACKAKRNAFAA